MKLNLFKSNEYKIHRIKLFSSVNEIKKKKNNNSCYQKFKCLVYFWDMIKNFKLKKKKIEL